jgi:MtrB/PioB family decaheme-associated outer membrane protein
MTQFSTPFRFQRSLLTLAVCGVCAAAQAEPKPVETIISVGIGALSGSSDDRALLGQYTGLRDRSGVGMLGIDYSLRNPDTSSSVDFHGSNLLGDTREMNLIWKNPGSWKFTADYGELVRVEPNSVNTGLLGVGSTTPQVVSIAAGGGIDTELKTKRTKLGLGFTKIISPTLQFAVDLKTENKDGARLSGISTNCPSAVLPGCLGWATLMLPEPINANHSQVEARLSYALDKFRFNVGYYGSFYRNNNATLSATVPGSLNNLPLNAGLQSLLGQPLALAPDNQAHQLDLSGSYDFTNTTRATFKLARASASQTDNFAAAGLLDVPKDVTNLGAQVNTKLAKIGITSRPIPKLSLIADLRYEGKDDQTPIAFYNSEAANNGQPPTSNRDLTSRKTNGKLQASWQFTSDYRGTLGADYEAIDRGTFTATSAAPGISALRQITDETTVHVELRRRMADDLSGSITLSSARRSGSNWLKDNNGVGLTEAINPADPATGLPASAIFMPNLADRQRDKVKLFADWQPSDKLNLQFGIEGGKDKFTTPSNYGLQNARMNQFSVDGSYALSDDWSLNGNVFRGVQSFNQLRPAGALMAYEDTNLGAAIGATGKASAKLNVGANLSYTKDRNVYAQPVSGLDSFAGADSIALLSATGGLPDVVFSQIALKLFGKYALEQKGASVRVDFVHQRNALNDWAWGYNGVPFAYSDGSTVMQKPTQSVSFIGVTYIYQLP